MSTNGTIWPEYWIACVKCECTHPLAVSKSPTREAKKQGWRREGSAYTGAWLCPECAAKTEVAL